MEIPFLLSYRFGVNNILSSVTNGSTFTKDMQLQAHLGPYLGVALKNDLCQRFDWGLQAGVGGLFLKHIYIGLSYDFGLAKPSVDYKATAKTRNLSVNIGYNF